MIRYGNMYLYDLRPVAFRLQYYLEQLDCVLTRTQLSALTLEVTVISITGRNRVNLAQLVTLFQRTLRASGTTASNAEILNVINKVYDYTSYNVTEEFALKVYHQGEFIQYLYDSERFMLSIKWESPPLLPMTPTQPAPMYLKREFGSSVQLDEEMYGTDPTCTTPTYSTVSH